LDLFVWLWLSPELPLNSSHSGKNPLEPYAFPGLRHPLWLGFGKLRRNPMRISANPAKLSDPSGFISLGPLGFLGIGLAFA
jgi:hypothetical protein